MYIVVLIIIKRIFNIIYLLQVYSTFIISVFLFHHDADTPNVHLRYFGKCKYKWKLIFRLFNINDIISHTGMEINYIYS